MSDDETQDDGETSGEDTPGEGGAESNWEKCEICKTATEDMSAHIESNHLDDLGAVQEHYQDRFDSLIQQEMDIQNQYRTGGQTESQTTTESDESQSSGSSESTPGGGQNEGSDNSPSSGDSTATLTGEKWYLIGVGGAGNKITDSILQRRESLKENSDPLSSVWESALTGFSMLNTNPGDIQSTHFYKDMNPEMEVSSLIEDHMIGVDHEENDYTGVGEDWELAKKFIEADFEDVDEDEDNPIQDPSGYDIEPDQLVRSQAVMIATSVTGGTGCGAAPVLAREIKELGFGKEKTILGTVVLPSEAEGEDGPTRRSNGCTGAARMSRFTDAILIFENDKLEKVNPELGKIKQLEHFPQYKNINNALAKYFEIFSMASIDDPEIRGDDFDINDALRPADRLRSTDDQKYKNEDNGLNDKAEEFDQPGLVLAPVIARSRASDMDRASLESLVERALVNNKLADFDPSTAWGGTFVFFGPDDRLDNDLCRYKFPEIVEEQYLEKPKDRITFVDTNVKVKNAEMLDSVYLWGFLWNPEVQSLQNMYDTAEKVKGFDKEVSEGVESVWNTVEGLFKLLGRKNLEGD